MLWQGIYSYVVPELTFRWATSCLLYSTINLIFPFLTSYFRLISRSRLVEEIVWAEENWLVLRRKNWLTKNHEYSLNSPWVMGNRKVVKHSDNSLVFSPRSDFSVSLRETADRTRDWINWGLGCVFLLLANPRIVNGYEVVTTYRVTCTEVTVSRRTLKIFKSSSFDSARPHHYLSRYMVRAEIAFLQLERPKKNQCSHTRISLPFDQDPSSSPLNHKSKASGTRETRAAHLEASPNSREISTRTSQKLSNDKQIKSSIFFIQSIIIKFSNF